MTSISRNLWFINISLLDFAVFRPVCATPFLSRVLTHVNLFFLHRQGLNYFSGRPWKKTYVKRTERFPAIAKPTESADKTKLTARWG